MRQPNNHRRWHKLDNTANLFPVITSRRFSNVFRLSVTLEKPVAPDLLQQALESTLPLFPSFQVRMRKGLFWRYFETNPAIPLIYEEDSYPCAYIDPQQNNHFLFRISYYMERINLEIFHSLTDGTGGLQFLRAVCCAYLLLADPASFTTEEQDRRWFTEHAADTTDSYVENYKPIKKSNFRIGRAYRITGERNFLDTTSVIHTYLPIDPLLALCREKQVSVTQYLTACIFWGLYTERLQKKASRYPVNLFLPVNLRNLFPSTTMLNFFSNIYISILLGKNEITFDEILTDVKQQFEAKITKEAMLKKISYTVGSGYSPLIRAVPLPLKSMILRIIFESSAYSSTLGFSNLGIVQMPIPFRKHVRGFSFLLSGSPREPFKPSAITYGNLLCFSFTSLLRKPDLQCAIIRHLASQGLDIVVETNGVDYESL